MSENNQTVYPFSVKTPFSNTAEIPKKPERIICLTPAAAETLDRLGQLNLIAGIPENCFISEESEIPIVGSYIKPDTEAILALNPDLVLGNDEIDSILFKKLEEQNIPYLVFTPSSFAQVMDFIKVLGEIIDEPVKADDLVKNLKQTSFNFRARTKNKRLLARIPERTVFIDLGHFFAPGKSTLLGNLLDLIGAVNIGAEKNLKYPHFLPEEVIEEEPDVYISFGEPMDNPELIEDFKEIPAARDNRVYFINDDSPEANIIQGPGVNVIEAIELLTKMIYPELF